MPSKQCSPDEIEGESYHLLGPFALVSTNGIPLHQRIERFVLIKQHAIGKHPRIVIGKYGLPPAGSSCRSPDTAASQSIRVPVSSFSEKNIALWRASESTSERSPIALAATLASSRRARSCQWQDSRSPRRRSCRKKTWTAVTFSQNVRSASWTAGVAWGKARGPGTCTAASQATRMILRGSPVERAEPDHDLRAHQRGLIEQRLVPDIEAVAVDRLAVAKPARAIPSSTFGRA